ncbi:MAG: D-alanine--D-alanine ligase [Spirochaetes bacterium]|nr:D-alanine--D-alanine ligase [Spirochaetota bacterium]
MLVGITYDLREEYRSRGFSGEDIAEFDSPATIDAIASTLESLGFDVERIGHIENLVRLLASGGRWDIVFNIAEGLRGIGREAQVPALLDAYGIPYTFSDPCILSLSLHKAMTKHVIRDLGIPTPDFFLLERLEDLKRVAIPCPLFAKPCSEGTGKGISPSSFISSRQELAALCEDLLERYRQSVLIEEYLPGREFTVGIIGSGATARVAGVVEVKLLSDAEKFAYSYANKENCEELVLYDRIDDDTAREAAEIALRAWRGLGCLDAGRVDLRCDVAGRPAFIEVNPLAGLHPEHSDLPIICAKHGIPYRELIGEIMRSALSRCGMLERVPGAMRRS